MARSVSAPLDTQSKAEHTFAGVIKTIRLFAVTDAS